MHNCQFRNILLRLFHQVVAYSKSCLLITVTYKSNLRAIILPVEIGVGCRFRFTSARKKGALIELIVSIMGFNITDNGQLYVTKFMKLIIGD